MTAPAPHSRFPTPAVGLLPARLTAEATARAREGAERFARDARSTLAGIRAASRGVFESLPRDRAPGVTEGSQRVKTVRVVTTPTYGLD